MNTAERIQKLLKDAGVPDRKIRRKLADLCGISYQAVKEWFDGSTRRISPEYLDLIAKEYDSSLEYLLTGKSAPTHRTGKQVYEVRKEGEYNKVDLEALLLAEFNALPFHRQLAVVSEAAKQRAEHRQEQAADPGERQA